MDVTLARILPTGQLPELKLAQPQSATAAIGSAEGSGGLAAPPADSFGTVLAQAMQGINQSQQTADADAARLAAGEPVDLHQVMIEMEQANLSFSLGLQVRNKLLEAYQDVMRMNV
jgi:flagellar hook-basal body complex protein FliE